MEPSSSNRVFLRNKEFASIPESENDCSSDTVIRVTKKVPTTFQQQLTNRSIDNALDQIRDSPELKEEFLQNAPPVDIYHKEYEIIRQISSGTFGSVHCVKKRDSKGTVHAAKYIKTSGEALYREINALISLLESHYILHFIGYYKQTNHDIKNVLVTEYLEGGDLVERTASKSYFLSEHKCRTIMRQVLLAVSHIHSRRFIHFDLKPFNIVFAKPLETNNDRDLRIIDFGCARELINDATSVNIGMTGTIEYMSPEVMNCSNAYYPADMWGIGCIAYQLLSGGMSPFFDSRSRYRTMEKILECNYSLEHEALRHVSKEALEFISQLLILEPEKRMTADQCLSHEWIQRHSYDDSDAVLRRSPSPSRTRHSAFPQYPSSLMIHQTLLRLPVPPIEEHQTLKKQRSSSLELIDTTWMRRSLARRRWYKVYGFLLAVNRFKPDHLLRPPSYSRQSSHDSKGSKQSRDSGISEKDFDHLMNYWKSCDKF